MTLAGHVLLASIPLLVSFYAERYKEADRMKAFPNNPRNLNLPVLKSFDFIVVGGGTAGCIVARRLVDANFTVLLLEAGGDPPPLQAIVGLSGITGLLPDINYAFNSVKQKNMELRNNGIVVSTGGRMMGGSSSHHGTMYERGHPKGYDEWAEWTGDESWKYKNILQYFKKSENYMGSFKDNLDQHGKGGPMHVTTSDKSPNLARSIWLRAGRELGYKVHDSHGPQQVGFSYLQMHQKFGRRVSTFTAYIQPIEGKKRKGRGKLTVHRYSIASKVKPPFHTLMILFENKRATGVLYKRHGIPRVARARKEVIVSTGAYLTPVLLIMSGIGPVDELVKAKVKPVSVLPVGENFQEHCGYPVTPILVNDSSLPWALETSVTFDDFTKYVNKGIGMLAYPSMGEAFIVSSRAKRHDPDWPDMQLFFTSQSPIPNTLRCTVVLNRPYSRGRITVNHTMSGPIPLIDLNGFDDPSDFDTMIEGINSCLNIIETTKTFKAVNARYGFWNATGLPECQDVPYRSRAYWICQLQNFIGVAHHGVGTCRMGKKNEAHSVVDSKLRVIGVKGLRVVDASIMPRSSNANTAGAVILIGEKGADMIIRSHKKNPSKIDTLSRK